MMDKNISKTYRFIIKMYRNIYKEISYRYWLIKCNCADFSRPTDGLVVVIENIPKIHLVRILRYLGAKIGENCRIERRLVLHNCTRSRIKKNLVLKDNVYIGYNVLLDILERITFEDDSAVGASCQIWTHVGNFSYNFSDYYEMVKPVTIGKGVICWSGTIVSPGVNIGSYSRIGAGSVVTKNIPEKEFWAGVPASHINKRKLEK